MSTEEFSLRFFWLSEAKASASSSSGSGKRIQFRSLLVLFVFLLSFVSFVRGVFLPHKVPGS